MKVNNTNSNIQNLVKETSKELNNTVNKSGNTGVEEKAFIDAAKIDITDPNAKKEVRVLSDETQQFLANSGVDLAQESSNFDKQSILGLAGSIVAAQGHANAVTTRALLS